MSNANLRDIQGASSTQTGDGFDVGEGISKFGLQVVFSGSTNDSAKVVLEGSIDGSNWGGLSGSTWSSTAGDTSTAVKSVTDVPVSYVRSKITAASSSQTIDTYIVSAP